MTEHRCQVCGGPVGLHHRTRPYKYCPECARCVHLEQQRAYNRKDRQRVRREMEAPSCAVLSRPIAWQHLGENDFVTRANRLLAQLG